MDRGLSAAAKLIGLIAALALAACMNVSPRAAAPGTPEAELALRATALQRTVQEAAVASATAGAGGAYLIAGKGPALALGFVAGIPIGITTGTYVGYLQQHYADNEARLARLRQDIDQTNAETRAAIRNMRAVLDQQHSQLAGLRAQPQAAGSSALAQQEQSARADLANMQLAIDGAENRLAEFNATRGLQLVPGQQTGVDAQIGELRQNIADMRAVAGQLSGQL